MAALNVSAEFTPLLQCLFKPKRYKVFWGGRGAGRSWGLARALLLEGVKRSLRVLCAREFQNSISESVHKILSDQISLLGLDSLYKVEVARIYGPNGTYFAFEGIKNNTNRIKSYEGLDVCWVEEANKVSRASWGILIPTIRKEGSEIWMSFNPELEEDYTYRRFVIEAGAGGQQMYEDPVCFVVKMTWRDNPWFPEVLREEMERDRKRDPDYYLNVWEGNCLQVLDGAIYARELRRAQSEGRICQVPYFAESPVDVFFDLGRADNTAMWAAQHVAMQYRILRYYSASGSISHSGDRRLNAIPMDDPSGGINHFLREIQSWGYVIGQIFLPHDAKAKRLGSHRSIEEMVRSAGFKVRVLPKLSVVDGVNAARTIFPNCYFDEVGCEDGLYALRHYRYRVKDGQLSNEPLHDWASDGADAWRYLAQGFREPSERGGVAARLADLVLQRRKKREEEMEFSGRPGGGRESTGLGWLGR